MGFNELNSVEHYIIHQLSGVNLNSQDAQEPTSTYGPTWVYIGTDELRDAFASDYKYVTKIWESLPLIIS